MGASGLSAAAAWLAARRSAGGSLVDWPASLKPADEAAAYDVQAEILAALAPRWGAQVGWKIGVTTPAMQTYLGIAAPIFAAMPAISRHLPGARVAHRDFCRPGIECEIAFVLARSLGGSATREDAVRAIGSVHPAIELVDDRYGGDYARMGVPAIIADFAFHAGFVLGEAVPNWRALDLASARGVTRANGRTMLEGRGADVMGHPLNSLLWLARRLGDMGRAIEPGAVVMTGSLPLPYWAAAGDEIEIGIEGLGSVRFAFA